MNKIELNLFSQRKSEELVMQLQIIVFLSFEGILQ
jgi:hypothetical protein